MKFLCLSEFTWNHFLRDLLGTFEPLRNFWAKCSEFFYNSEFTWNHFCWIKNVFSDLHPGIHTSSCGHVMHASCWKTYFEDIQNSERNRSRLRSPQNFNALKQVFKFLLFVHENFLINFKFFRNFCAHCAEVCQILWFPWFLNSTHCNL